MLGMIFATMWVFGNFLLILYFLGEIGKVGLYSGILLCLPILFMIIVFFLDYFDNRTREIEYARKIYKKALQKEIFQSKEKYLKEKREFIEELERYIKELNSALKQFKKEKWID